MMDAMEVAAALRRAAERCDGCSLESVRRGADDCPDCQCRACREKSVAWFNEAADAIERCALPGGVEWPRFEDGEPVRFGDAYVKDNGNVGTVLKMHVGTYMGETPFWTVGKGDGKLCITPGKRLKRPPVLAADGEPLEVGQTVYGTRDQTPVEVIATHSHEYDGIRTVKCKDANGCLFYCPEDLTHANPEPPDTWERIEEDADALVDAEINGDGSYNAANAYCNRRGLGEGTSFVLIAQDLVRRCRALAEHDAS